MAKPTYTEMKINGKGCESAINWTVEKGVRKPKVPFTPYFKVEPGPAEIAGKMAEHLMYYEIIEFLQVLLDKVNDPDLTKMIYREVNGRIVAKRLMEKEKKLPRRVEIDEDKLPDNPFKIDRKGKGFALHEIMEDREKLIGQSNLSLVEKLWLYRLRIAELLWILGDSEDHFGALKEDYEKVVQEKHDLELALAHIEGDIEKEQKRASNEG